MHDDLPPDGIDRSHPPVNDEDPTVDEVRLALTARLGELRQQHQDLDAAIRALETLQAADQLQIARLKKQKLGLRDMIVKLEDQLTPDIIA